MGTASSLMRIPLAEDDAKVVYGAALSVQTKACVAPLTAAGILDPNW